MLERFTTILGEQLILVFPMGLWVGSKGNGSSSFFGVLIAGVSVFAIVESGSSHFCPRRRLRPYQQERAKITRSRALLQLMTSVLSEPAGPLGSSEGWFTGYLEHFPTLGVGQYAPFVGAKPHGRVSVVC